MDYQGDPEKADPNYKKHGIDFADAVGVFEDEWALTVKQDIRELWILRVSLPNASLSIGYH